MPKDIIDQLCNATNMIHVGDPGAYEAFAYGKVIFDTSPDGRLPDAFVAELEPQFSGVIIRRKPYTLPAIVDVWVHAVYHKYKAVESGSKV